MVMLVYYAMCYLFISFHVSMVVDGDGDDGLLCHVLFIYILSRVDGARCMMGYYTMSYLFISFHVHHVIDDDGSSA